MRSSNHRPSAGFVGQRASLAALAASFAVLLAVAAPVTRAAEAPPSFQELEESLTCQCGCGLTVHSCNHLQCPSALPLRVEIREQLAAGKNKAEILGYFGDKYGEKILSSPTTSGFNLLAWTTPFIAVLIGGVIILLIARSWTRKRPSAPAATATPPAGAASPYRERLDKELEDFDR